jgi:peroxiredoxin Q/BCP
MANIKEGEKAPDFTAKDQNGNDISLADFKGKTIILYFYPKDNTPGCTAEACDFRDNYQSLLADGFQVIGVSTDDEVSHKKFESKYQLPFPLIADTDMGTARNTFIIDENGLIKHIITKVDSKAPSAQIRKLLT